MIASRPLASHRTAAGAERILFVYDRDFSTFIERDWNIVQAAFPKARLFRFGGFGDTWSLRKALQTADLCLAWFGSRHALAAAELKPKRTALVIVAGGFDVARVAEIGYGAFVRGFRGALGRRMFGRADRVFAVSEFTARAAKTNAGVPTERIRTIFHGFDAADWPLGNESRSLDAVTITTLDPVVKGLDLVFGAADAHPTRRFEVIGPLVARASSRIAAPKPDNVHFTGPLYGDELKQRLAKAKVYLQPSRHESFGCAVAEAMLTGCIPVVTLAGALPEVVGDAGFYADATPTAVARALEAAWAAPESARAAARARIDDLFPLDRYAARLVENLRELLD